VKQARYQGANRSGDRLLRPPRNKALAPAVRLCTPAVRFRERAEKGLR